MNADEIRAMPAGREMDAHIHELVIGKRVTWNVLNLSGGVDKFAAEYPLPFYSTDIAAAWEVVEKMSEYADAYSKHSDETWPRFIDELHGSMLFAMGGAWASRQICRAALLAGDAK